MLAAAEDCHATLIGAFVSFTKVCVETVQDAFERVYLFFVPPSPIELHCNKHGEKSYSKTACVMLYKAAEFPSKFVGTVTDNFEKISQATRRMFIKEDYKAKTCGRFNTVLIRKICDKGFDVVSKAQEAFEQVQEILDVILQSVLNFMRTIYEYVSECLGVCAQRLQKACQRGLDLGERITTYIYQGLNIETIYGNHIFFNLYFFH